LQLCFAGGVGFGFKFFSDERIDQRIDAADEEARHARQFAYVAAVAANFSTPSINAAATSS